MNVWSVGWPRCNYPEDQEWHLVWAWGSDEAINIAWQNREWTGDGCGWSPPQSEVDEMIVNFHPGINATPRLEGPHEERRYQVMRLCGWRDEGDTFRCEDCGAWAMGLVAMCDRCLCCAECGCECGEEVTDG